ncbi:nose resistant to fluoxetine protein 6-like isoform X3 [Palaemon carinicauda]|uniref:nose resistant to fluoxetine protein 6-like isoform X3 n=1 Tax=Palaemon carinicauda TaxID=392227 RepID=UPI0035B5BDE3
MAREFLNVILLVGIAGLTSGQQIDWEIVKRKPLDMFERYGNPAYEALKGLPRLLGENSGIRDEASPLEAVRGIYLPIANEELINPQCLEDVKNLMRVWNHPSVLNYIMTILHQNWPATLPDSWGVPGDGILNGNSILWGFQEECTAVVANVTKGFVVPFNATFRGKYCLVHVENTNSSLNYNPSPGSLQEKVYRDILNAPDYYYFGTCMPSSCGESDLVTSYNFSFKNTGWSLVDIRCQTADREYVEKSDGDIAFIVIVSLIWCTIVGAAILEFFVNWAKKPDIRKGPLKYWLVLSSYRSMSNIYKFVNKTNPDVINCLHGLRVMSMIWVTWCHSYSLFSKVTQNLKGLQNCLPQSWYTAADSQLYLILPVILIPLMLNRKIGLIILSAVTVASFAIPCSLYAAFNLKPYLPFAIPEISPEETALNHDHMPWGRASPYFIGVWGGWLLSVYKDRRVKMPLWGVVLGWCVSATVSCLVLLGMAPYNTASAPTELPSGISVFYGGFSRGAWALSLLWVVFACQKGFGGPVNTFLGHACWLPMSRLSYSMFLISVPVQILSSGITMIPLYMNHLNKFIETCGYLFVGGLMATAMAITSEIPVLSLEKAIIPRPGRNVQDEPLKES